MVQHKPVHHLELEVSSPRSSRIHNWNESAGLASVLSEIDVYTAGFFNFFNSLSPALNSQSYRFNCRSSWPRSSICLAIHISPPDSQPIWVNLCRACVQHVNIVKQINSWFDREFCALISIKNCRFLENQWSVLPVHCGQPSDRELSFHLWEAAVTTNWIRNAQSLLPHDFNPQWLHHYSRSRLGSS